MVRDGFVDQAALRGPLMVANFPREKSHPTSSIVNRPVKRGRRPTREARRMPRSLPLVCKKLAPTRLELDRLDGIYQPRGRRWLVPWIGTGKVLAWSAIDRVAT